MPPYWDCGLRSGYAVQFSRWGVDRGCGMALRRPLPNWFSLSKVGPIHLLLEFRGIQILRSSRLLLAYAPLPRFKVCANCAPKANKMPINHECADYGV